MKHLLKRTAAFLAVMVLCLSCASVASGEQIFGDDFVAACNPPDDDTLGCVGFASVKDTVYQLVPSGNIYSWDSQTGEYALYAHVPEFPTMDVEKTFVSQSDEKKAKVASAVAFLIPAADGLYGFNNYTGAIGLIDKDGIHLNDVRLDVSSLMRNDCDYPTDFLFNMFVEEGKLYAYNDMGLSTSKNPQPRYLIFDLSTGTCTSIDLPGTISACRHTAGKLLCLQDGGTATPTLTVYDIASGKMEKLDLTVPVSITSGSFAKKSWQVHCEIGGLTYDAERDIIYLVDAKQGLWRSTSCAPFERTELEHALEPPISVGENAQVLSSGGYVLRYDQLYYVKP